LRTPFFFLYFILSIFFYVIALPLILYLSFRHKYKVSIPARFFLQKNASFEPDGIWFHACSLGEAKALAPFIEHIKHSKVNISVITHTGYSAARSFTDATVRYLPYEMFLPWWQKRQKLLVVLEAELWVALFVVAKAKGAKTVLLNARISERSYPKYLKMKWLYQRLFTYVDLIYVQSQQDQERFESLGAKNIRVIGNIKLAQRIEATKAYEKPEGMTIVAGSTHETEEELIIQAFDGFKQKHPEARLIIVPRHPERFEKVHTLLESYAKEEGLKYSRFSQDNALGFDITLIDAMGELNNIYAISDIAILGGGFAPIGGHNPLEPIAFSCKVISGKEIFNQKELFKYVQHAQIVENDAIEAALEKAVDMPPSQMSEGVELKEVYALLEEYDHE
jgi:3-deoxy-D-manno-octulosonic-acid transferase